MAVNLTPCTPNNSSIVEIDRHTNGLLEYMPSVKVMSSVVDNKKEFDGIGRSGKSGFVLNPDGETIVLVWM